MKYRVLGHRLKRVPQVLQLDQTECGAACLAALLRFHGHQVGLADTREVCAPGRDGVTAKTLKQAAESYGLTCRAYSVRSVDDLRRIPTPNILHWKFNHFVVLEGQSNKRATLMDPALGRRSISLDELNRSFTGIVLELLPGRSEKEEPNEKKEGAAIAAGWRKLLIPAMKLPGRWLLGAQLLLSSILLQAFGLAVPLATKILVDEVIGQSVRSLFPVLMVAILCLGILTALSALIRSLLVVYIQASLDARLMLVFLKHVLQLPFSFFQRRSSGDILMRLSSNSVIRDVLTGQSVGAFLDIVTVVAYGIALSILAPGFLGLTVALGALQLLIVGLALPLGRLLTQLELEAQAQSQGYLVEALNGIEALKANGAEGRVFSRWEGLLIGQLNASARRGRFYAISNTPIVALRTSAPLLLLAYGAHEVLIGGLSLGAMLGLNAIALSMLAPLQSIASTVQQLHVVAGHFHRLTDVLSMRTEKSGRIVRTNAKGAIELEDVSFAYDPHAPPILNNVSLRVRPGQKVAIVGASGSGKTSALRLLLGLYYPTSGRVLYDGLATTDWDIRALRSQFGVVTQTPLVFGGSIRQNIALRNPEASFEHISRAAELAGLNYDIARMPMGFETLVSEGGSALSGGQRQRLALAQALVCEPSVLVLDEATSHLDAVSEASIMRAVNALDCTRIVVAHRLSTVIDADHIVVLQDGTVVEQGTHHELLALRGHYFALAFSQLGRAHSNESGSDSQTSAVAK